MKNGGRLRRPSVHHIFADRTERIPKSETKSATRRCLEVFRATLGVAPTVNVYNSYQDFRRAIMNCRDEHAVSNLLDREAQLVKPGLESNDIRGIMVPVVENGKVVYNCMVNAKSHTPATIFEELAHASLAAYLRRKLGSKFDYWKNVKSNAAFHEGVAKAIAASILEEHGNAYANELTRDYEKDLHESIQSYREFAENLARGVFSAKNKAELDWYKRNFFDEKALAGAIISSGNDFNSRINSIRELVERRLFGTTNAVLFLIEHKK